MKHPKCRTCGKEHALGGCPEFKSTAARKDVQHMAVSRPHVTLQKADIESQVSTVDTNLIVGVDTSSSKDFGAKVIGRVMEDGRIEILSLTHSKAQFNKPEYQRQYMADQRTIKRLGLNCTVKEWREKNG